MFSLSKDKKYLILIFFVALMIYIQGLNVHGLEYRDDEIFYYQSTQEMLKTGNLMSPTYFGEDRFQKPILYYWLILLSYKIFGVHWFAARFVAVVFACLSVCLTWVLARDLFDKKVALVSAGILMTIPLFFRHAKNAVPDMPLTFFIILSIYAAVKFLKTRENKYSLLFFISAGLGFMIKGFAAILIPFATVILYALMIKKPRILLELRFGRGLLVMLCIILPWFLYMIALHGSSYLNYLLVDETQYRLMGSAEGNIIIYKIKSFVEHMFFYLKVIGSYFAPWSIFLIGAIPLSVSSLKTKSAHREGLMIMLIWLFFTFLFFSTMYFVINHYMMSLTAPFAILLGYFFVEHARENTLAEKVKVFFQKYFIVFLLIIGCLGYGFLVVFLASKSQWWLLVFLAAAVFLTVLIHKSHNHLFGPLALAIFMISGISQSTLLSDAGVTAHSTLQKFAQTINQEDLKAYTISVASNDLHEKEFQVYFDRKVQKVATSDDDTTQERIRKLFDNNEKVVCLLTEEDFHKFLNNEQFHPGEIIQEEYIFRKRMYIDQGFFQALLKLDQDTVFHYLKEKVVLVLKDENV